MHVARFGQPLASLAVAFELDERHRASYPRLRDARIEFDRLLVMRQRRLKPSAHAQGPGKAQPGFQEIRVVLYRGREPFDRFLVSTARAEDHAEAKVGLGKLL